MCGIIGFNWEDEVLLNRMCNKIRHRGPDDNGTFFSNNVSLGHLRLSIIDLSSRGRQPMCNEEGDIWIVYNGECYNYLGIKKKLVEKGHKFNSDTDTEVIVHAYEEYGLDCVKKIDGIFAFCIYDSRKNIFFLARDRFGIKPLYYYVKNDKFVFGSEIKAMLEFDEIKRDINKQAVYDYISYRYVPEPKTIFTEINKVPNGSYIVYNLKNNSFYLKRYYQLLISSKEKNEQYCKKKIKKILTEAVSAQLMSDVPFGVFLSGGLDSGAVTGIMSKIIEQPVKTFSIGYNIPGFVDELDAARMTSDYFKTDHKEVVLKKGIMKYLPKVIYHMDEPVADPAAVPTFLLSEETKKKVTVIQVGEGGDEVFGGYEQYWIMNLAEKYLKKIPKIARKKMLPFVIDIIPSKVLDRKFKYASLFGQEGKERFYRFVGDYDGKYEDYFKLIGIADEEDKKRIFLNNNYEDSARLMKPFFNNKHCRTIMDKTQMVDSNTYLFHLLEKVDKTTMAFAVEARVPLLDSKLVDFMSNVHSNLKMKGKCEKYIFKQAVKDTMPKFLIKRKKQRFFVPIHYWIEKELKDDVKEYLSPENIKRRGYFNYRYIEHMLKNYKKSKLYYGRLIWNMLVLELWHRKFIDDAK